MDLKIGQKFHLPWRTELNHLVGFVKDGEKEIVTVKYWNNYDKRWGYDAVERALLISRIEWVREWERDERRRKRLAKA